MEKIVTDEAVQQAIGMRSGPTDRAGALAAFKFGDSVFRRLTVIAAVLVLVILGAIIISLIVGAWPAITTFGIGFLWTSTWDAPRQIFGGMVPIIGTLITSAI